MYHVRESSRDNFLNKNNMRKIASELIRKHGLFDSFYVANLKTLDRKIDEWNRLLPNVQPFYAMKCHPDETIMRRMIARGFGLDVASLSEIDHALSLGCRADSIIYAHPVKRIDELMHAVKSGIRYTTFDSLSEIEKIEKHAPNMRCLIRLRIDNPTARVQLGLKYGVARDEYKELIDFARVRRLNVVGASFHVGSASSDPSVFYDGIRFSSEVMRYAATRGYSMELLDVGGGFSKDNFVACSENIRTALKACFASDERPRVIAEPGRFFAEETFDFFTPVVGNRRRDGKTEYWISDGLYGSFNCMLYDGQMPSFEVLRNPTLARYEGSEEPEECVIFGITCDSADRLGEFKLPPLRNGDYIAARAFGAYTIAGSCNFNGINMMSPRKFYIEDASHT